MNKLNMSEIIMIMVVVIFCGFCGFCIWGMGLQDLKRSWELEEYHRIITEQINKMNAESEKMEAENKELVERIRLLRLKLKNK